MDKTIEFGGVKCFYKTTGTGPCLVLVHGFLEEGSMWDGIIQPLAKQYSVIVPDLPGFGASALPPAKEKLSMEFYAAYVRAVLQQEKVKECVLLGHSMGGYITLSFAEKHSRLLRGFGLINSHCYADSEEKKANRKKGMAHVKKYGTEAFVTELYRTIFTDGFQKKSQKLVNGLIAKAVRYSPEAVMRATEAMMLRDDKSAVLRKTKLPVLLLNGADDLSAPLELTMQQAMLPAVTDFHLHKGVKHMSVFERKAATQKAIADFTARCF